MVLQIQGLNINFWQSICDIATNTNNSIGTIQGLVKKGLLKKRRQNLKPLLTDNHKLLRVAWIRNPIEEDWMYCNMMQYIHINEKWFTLVTDGDGYYLSTAEQQNYRNVQHKKHITKVIFLLAIARPCIIPSTGEMFDGKIGIWAFAEERPATRNSKN